jgi:hypothetical protein
MGLSGPLRVDSGTGQEETHRDLGRNGALNYYVDKIVHNVLLLRYDVSDIH